MKKSKKLLVLALCALLLCGLFLPVFPKDEAGAKTSILDLAVSAAASGESIGDVNGDGLVNIADITLLAKYVAGWNVTLGAPKRTVTFKDWNGTVLKTELVLPGGSATPPADPQREGYTFIGWSGTYTNVSADCEIIAQYEKDSTDPALAVANVSAHAGDTQIAVPVSVKSNPGVLAMECRITYDESALTLTRVTKGSAFTAYTFTAPKNCASGCRAAWNINDLPAPTPNGEIMVLYFTVSAQASAGAHTVTVSCPSGGTFDGDYNVVEIASGSGSVTVG